MVGHGYISISITQNPQIKTEIAYEYRYPPGGPSVAYDPIFLANAARRYQFRSVMQQAVTAG